MERKAIQFDDYIYVVGNGFSQPSSARSAVYAINHLENDTVTFVGDLVFNVYAPSVIIANGIAYAFGNYSGEKDINSQRLPPTESPTADPTVDRPTADPTRNPTSEPTQEPTGVPSVDPTVSPTTCFDTQDSFSNDGVNPQERMDQLDFAQ